MWRIAVCVVLCSAASLGPAVAQGIRALPLRASALAAEPLSRRLYVALAPDAGPGANGVVAIDPVTATQGPPLFVGSDPRVLVPTEDGQYLYVGLAGATAIRRVDLASGTAGPLFPLVRAGDFGDPEYARAIVPVPGSPGTVVVGQGGVFSSYFSSLVVYDDGVARPARVTDTAESLVAIDATTFVATSGTTLLRLRLDPSGISVVARTASITGLGRLAAVADGLLYDVMGTAVDAATLQVVRAPRGRLTRADVRLVAPGQGRLVRADAGELITHALATFDVLATTRVVIDHGQPHALALLGGGMAYITRRSMLVLVGDFAAPPPDPPSAGPLLARVDLPGCTQCRGGDGFRATVTFANTQSVPVRAEIKARILSPWGQAVLTTPFASPHAEIDLPPGGRTLTLLEGVVPASVPSGWWRIDLQALDPASGRIFATSTRWFRVGF